SNKTSEVKQSSPLLEHYPRVDDRRFETFQTVWERPRNISRSGQVRDPLGQRGRARAGSLTPLPFPLARGRTNTARPQMGSFGSGPPAGTSISNVLALKASSV